MQSLKPLDLAEINREFRAIAAANKWQAYHTPKNLASAVAVEASELLAEFQWLTAEESVELTDEKRTQVADEIADIVMYLTELSMQLDIDLAAALGAKIQKNKIRFKQP
ncbi:nucleotide pyrophosphohydrolase [Cellvibrio zantedeschiae]|uniref:nucleotide pyrophosphohydrolase n=1 Tax=Cellvibrio zantedeschiae TaxID=1237077 RepID=UPI001E5B6737|nr:nucleotide pyrophosphohydrolase [Cellvibrio zantedeschiae]